MTGVIEENGIEGGRKRLRGGGRRHDRRWVCRNDDDDYFLTNMDTKLGGILS